MSHYQIYNRRFLLVCMAIGACLFAGCAAKMSPAHMSVPASRIAGSKTLDSAAPAALNEIGALEALGETASGPSYNLGPDDEVKITVFGEEDLSDTYKVA